MCRARGGQLGAIRYLISPLTATILSPPPLLPEFPSSFSGLVDVTGVQRPRVVGSLAEGLMELELKDETDKVPTQEETKILLNLSIH